MDSSWRVDSYHLGLGVVGDSAIQLLVNQPNAGGPGSVEFALLVDGGDSGGQKRILDTIQKIEALTTMYDLSPLSSSANPTLKFNAIVISHWDTDHWSGVLFAMREDIDTQWEATKGPVTDFEVSFLQYEAATPPAKRTPKTIVYCPAYGIPTMGCHLRPSPKTAAVANVDLVLRKDDPAKSIVSNAVRMRMEPTLPPTGTNPSLVGTNILTGTDLTVASGSTTISTYQAIVNPAGLVQNNAPAVNGQPGIYIVGISMRTIGPPSTNVAPPPDMPGVVNETTGGRPKNMSSVACMIIWPGTPPRLSHYFAGDMHWIQEQQIVQWTGTNGTRTNGGSWVATVKSSHHGSKSSTPTTLLSMFNPRSLIASVGERNGHPSWELIFYVEGWMYSEGPDKAAYRPLLSTQFPYYLILQEDASGGRKWLPLPNAPSHQMSMDILTSTSAVAKEYRNALKAIYATASVAMASSSSLDLKSPVDAWEDAKTADPAKDPKEWARTRIAAAWDRLSPISPTAHAALGQVRLEANYTLLTAADAVAWYRIECHDDDDKDGSVWVKYDSGSVECQLWPDPDAVAPTPMDISMPSDPEVLGSKRNAVDTFPPAASTEDPVTKKQKNATTPNAVCQPLSSLYNPAPGTNPDENDDMMVDDDPKNSTMSPGLVGYRAAAAAAPTQPLQHRPPPGDAPGLQAPYYFICSSIVEFDSPPGTQVNQLTLTDPLNNFLSTLHLQGLILSNNPNTSAPTPLHSQDEFQMWLTMALGIGSHQTASVTVATDSTSGAITGFTVTIPALGLTFSSTATVNSLNAQPDWGLGPASTVPWQNSLILGLEDATKVSGLSLIDILAPASVRQAALPGLQLLQLALGNKLLFNIDVAQQGSRNALWFEPMQGYKTVVRTQYVADSTSLANANSWIGGFLNEFSIQSITVITKLQSAWATTNQSTAALNTWEFIFTTTVQLTGVDIVPTVTFDFAGSLLTTTLQFDYVASGQGNLLSQIMAWIGNQEALAGAQFLFNDWFQSAGTSNFDLPLLRRIVLAVGLDPNTGIPTGSIEDVRVDLELGVKFGQSDNGNPQKVIFLFNYRWTQAQGSVLRGALWTPPLPAADVDRRLLPEYEPYTQFEPASINDGSTWAPTLNLANLIPNDPGSGASGGKIINIPDGVPTDVIMAVLQLDSTSISFQGAIECLVPTSDTIPKLFLSRLTLGASYTFATKVFDLSFEFAVAMYPQIGSLIVPIELRGLLSYDSQSGFDAEADVECPGMQGAHFLDYFDTNSASAATALIQHIQLLYLHLEYHYQNSSGQTNPAKSFAFAGALAIGKLELDLQFNYTGQDTWSFTAQVGANGEECTIQEILDSIAGDGTVDLPSCVGDILVGKPTPLGTTMSGDDDDVDDGVEAARDFVNLTLARLDNTGSSLDDGSAQTVLFTVSVNVGPVAFTFLQFRDISWDANTTASKRFLRLEVNALPAVDVPIIGNLTQPFDEMYFMWVQDGSNTTPKAGPAGLTKAQVTLLNSVLGDDPIYYKLTKDADAYTATDVIVQAGFHFVLILKDPKTGAPDVVLDYVFGQPDPTDSHVPPPTEALRAHSLHQSVHGANAVVPSRRRRTSSNEAVVLVGQKEQQDDEPEDSNPADAGGGTTKAAMKKSIGPFTISNIGLKFSNSTLSVCLDAAVAIGPIAMALLGFSIDLDFGDGHSLQNNFPTPGNGISVSLQGMAASFNKPPVTIAGGLMKQALPGGTFYAGGVDVGFVPWAFLAAGGYGELTDPITQQLFKTAFVFANLQGPLITLEFATISGVTGGFGYNSSLTLPTVAEVPSFPFLQMPTITPVTTNPTLDTFLTLINSKWFNPLDGSFWVAAGLTVTAFEMLDITAVAVVEWDTDVKLGIFAVAVADVPSSAAEFKLAHVELGILATVDFGLGVAKFEAQLAPSSFILDPTCHLSGGFALYYWFKDGPQQTKGDWVFTIGGYHQLYKPPPQYPVPPRLQISWSLGPLSIVGQAYFAITPNVAMAGGLLHASLSLGVLQAFLDAYADFLINFRPFTFTAGGGVSVGVKFTLDLWFVTIRISVEIGATLVLEGPPLSGTCHVNFWVFGFDIKFGDHQTTAPAAIHLADFYNLVLQSDSSSAQQITPTGQVIACKSGLVPSSSPPASSLSLSLSSSSSKAKRKPVGRITEVEDDIEDDDAPIWEVKAGTFTFTISTVFALSTVTVYPTSNAPIVYNAPKPDTVGIYSRPMYITNQETAITSNLNVTIEIATGDSKEDYEPQWELEATISNAPKALWDAYNPSSDPTKGSTTLLNGTTTPTVPLMMGVLFHPPPPILSADLIPAFDAVLSQLQDVTPDPPPPLPNSTTQEDTAWLPVAPTPPPPSDPAAPWQAVQDLWTSPKLGPGSAAEAVQAWVGVMVWGVDAGLTGEVPVRLVQGLQEMYVAAPLVAAAAVAAEAATECWVRWTAR